MQEITLNNQVITMPDTSELEEIFNTGVYMGSPIGAFNILVRQKQYLTIHNFVLGFIRYKATGLTWLPLFLFVKDNQLLRVALAYRSCKHCGWYGAIATVLQPDLYFTLENQTQLLKNAVQYGSLPCPVCQSHIEAGIVWVDSPSL